MTPPSVELPPATQSVSEYCVRARTRGRGSSVLVTATRAPCRSRTRAWAGPSRLDSHEDGAFGRPAGGTRPGHSTGRCHGQSEVLVRTVSQRGRLSVAALLSAAELERCPSARRRAAQRRKKRRSRQERTLDSMNSRIAATHCSGSSNWRKCVVSGKKS